MQHKRIAIVVQRKNQKNSLDCFIRKVGCIECFYFYLSGQNARFVFLFEFSVELVNCCKKEKMRNKKQKCKKNKNREIHKRINFKGELIVNTIFLIETIWIGKKRYEIQIVFLGIKDIKNIIAIVFIKAIRVKESYSSSNFSAILNFMKTGVIFQKKEVSNIEMNFLIFANFKEIESHSKHQTNCEDRRTEIPYWVTMNFLIFINFKEIESHSKHQTNCEDRRTEIPYWVEYIAQSIFSMNKIYAQKYYNDPNLRNIAHFIIQNKANINFSLCSSQKIKRHSIYEKNIFKRKMNDKYTLKKFICSSSKRLKTHELTFYNKQEKSFCVQNVAEEFFKTFILLGIFYFYLKQHEINYANLSQIVNLCDSEVEISRNVSRRRRKKRRTKVTTKVVKDKSKGIKMDSETSDSETNEENSQKDNEKEKTLEKNLQSESEKIPEGNLQNDIKNKKISKESSQIDTKSEKVLGENLQNDIKNKKISKESLQVDTKSEKIPEKFDQHNIKNKKIFKDSSQIDIKGVKVPGENLQNDISSKEGSQIDTKSEKILEEYHQINKKANEISVESFNKALLEENISSINEFLKEKSGMKISRVHLETMDSDTKITGFKHIHDSETSNEASSVPNNNHKLKNENLSSERRTLKELEEIVKTTENDNKDEIVAIVQNNHKKGTYQKLNLINFESEISLNAFDDVKTIHLENKKDESDLVDQEIDNNAVDEAQKEFQDLKMRETTPTDISCDNKYSTSSIKQINEPDCEDNTINTVNSNSTTDHNTMNTNHNTINTFNSNNNTDHKTINTVNGNSNIDNDNNNIENDNKTFSIPEYNNQNQTNNKDNLDSLSYDQLLALFKKPGRKPKRYYELLEEFKKKTEPVLQTSPAKRGRKKGFRVVKKQNQKRGSVGQNNNDIQKGSIKRYLNIVTKQNSSYEEDTLNNNQDTEKDTNSDNKGQHRNRKTISNHKNEYDSQDSFFQNENVSRDSGTGYNSTDEEDYSTSQESTSKNLQIRSNRTSILQLDSDTTTSTSFVQKPNKIDRRLKEFRHLRKENKGEKKKIPEKSPFYKRKKRRGRFRKLGEMKQTANLLEQNKSTIKHNKLKIVEVKEKNSPVMGEIQCFGDGIDSNNLKQSIFLYNMYSIHLHKQILLKKRFLSDTNIQNHNLLSKTYSLEENCVSDFTIRKTSKRSQIKTLYSSKITRNFFKFLESFVLIFFGSQDSFFGVEIHKRFIYKNKKFKEEKDTGKKTLQEWALVKKEDNCDLSSDVSNRVIFKNAKNIQKNFYDKKHVDFTENQQPEEIFLDKNKTVELFKSTDTKDCDSKMKKRLFDDVFEYIEVYRLIFVLIDKINYILHFKNVLVLEEICECFQYDRFLRAFLTIFRKDDDFMGYIKKMNDILIQNLELKNIDTNPERNENDQINLENVEKMVSENDEENSEKMLNEEKAVSEKNEENKEVDEEKMVSEKNIEEKMVSEENEEKMLSEEMKGENEKNSEEILNEEKKGENEENLAKIHFIENTTQKHYIENILENIENSQSFFKNNVDFDNSNLLNNPDSLKNNQIYSNKNSEIFLKPIDILEKSHYYINYDSEAQSETFYLKKTNLKIKEIKTHFKNQKNLDNFSNPKVFKKIKNKSEKIPKKRPGRPKKIREEILTPKRRPGRPPLNKKANQPKIKKRKYVRKTSVINESANVSSDANYKEAGSINFKKRVYNRNKIKNLDSSDLISADNVSKKRDNSNLDTSSDNSIEVRKNHKLSFEGRSERFSMRNGLKSGKYSSKMDPDKNIPQSSEECSNDLKSEKLHKKQTENNQNEIESDSHEVTEESELLDSLDSNGQVIHPVNLKKIARSIGRKKEPLLEFFKANIAVKINPQTLSKSYYMKKKRGRVRFDKITKILEAFPNIFDDQEHDAEKITHERKKRKYVRKATLLSVKDQVGNPGDIQNNTNLKLEDLKNQENIRKTGRRGRKKKTPTISAENNAGKNEDAKVDDINQATKLENNLENEQKEFMYSLNDSELDFFESGTEGLSVENNLEKSQLSDYGFNSQTRHLSLLNTNKKYGDSLNITNDTPNQTTISNFPSTNTSFNNDFFKNGSNVDSASVTTTNHFLFENVEYLRRNQQKSSQKQPILTNNTRDEFFHQNNSVRNTNLLGNRNQYHFSDRKLDLIEQMATDLQNKPLNNQTASFSDKKLDFIEQMATDLQNKPLNHQEASFMDNNKDISYKRSIFSIDPDTSEMKNNQDSKQSQTSHGFINFNDEKMSCLLNNNIRRFSFFKNRMETYTNNQIKKDINSQNSFNQGLSVFGNQKIFSSNLNQIMNNNKSNPTNLRTVVFNNSCLDNKQKSSAFSNMKKNETNVNNNYMTTNAAQSIQNMITSWDLKKHIESIKSRTPNNSVENEHNKLFTSSVYNKNKEVLTDDTLKHLKANLGLNASFSSNLENVRINLLQNDQNLKNYIKETDLHDIKNKTGCLSRILFPDTIERNHTTNFSVPNYNSGSENIKMDQVDSLFSQNYRYGLCENFLNVKSSLDIRNSNIDSIIGDFESEHSRIVQINPFDFHLADLGEKDYENIKEYEKYKHSEQSYLKEMANIKNFYALKSHENHLLNMQKMLNVYQDHSSFTKPAYIAPKSILMLLNELAYIKNLLGSKADATISIPKHGRINLLTIFLAKTLLKTIKISKNNRCRSNSIQLNFEKNKACHTEYSKSFVQDDVFYNKEVIEIHMKHDIYDNENILINTVAKNEQKLSKNILNPSTYKLSVNTFDLLRLSFIEKKSVLNSIDFEITRKLIFCHLELVKQALSHHTINCKYLLNANSRKFDPFHDIIQLCFLKIYFGIKAVQLLYLTRKNSIIKCKNNSSKRENSINRANAIYLWNPPQTYAELLFSVYFSSLNYHKLMNLIQFHLKEPSNLIDSSNKALKSHISKFKKLIDSFIATECVDKKILNVNGFNANPKQFTDLNKTIHGKNILLNIDKHSKDICDHEKYVPLNIDKHCKGIRALESNIETEMSKHCTVSTFQNFVSKRDHKLNSECKNHNFFQQTDMIMKEISIFFNKNNLFSKLQFIESENVLLHSQLFNIQTQIPQILANFILFEYICSLCFKISFKNDSMHLQMLDDNILPGALFYSKLKILRSHKFVDDGFSCFKTPKEFLKYYKTHNLKISIQNRSYLSKTLLFFLRNLTIKKVNEDLNAKIHKLESLGVGENMENKENENIYANTQENKPSYFKMHLPSRNTQSKNIKKRSFSRPLNPVTISKSQLYAYLKSHNTSVSFLGYNLSLTKDFSTKEDKFDFLEHLSFFINHLKNEIVAQITFPLQFRAFYDFENINGLLIKHKNKKEICVGNSVSLSENKIFHTFKLAEKITQLPVSVILRNSNKLIEFAEWDYAVWESEIVKRTKKFKDILLKKRKSTLSDKNSATNKIKKQKINIGLDLTQQGIVLETKHNERSMPFYIKSGRKSKKVLNRTISVLDDYLNQNAFFSSKNKKNKITRSNSITVSKSLSLNFLVSKKIKNKITRSNSIHVSKSFSLNSLVSINTKNKIIRSNSITVSRNPSRNFLVDKKTKNKITRSNSISASKSLSPNFLVGKKTKNKITRSNSISASKSLSLNFLVGEKTKNKTTRSNSIPISRNLILNSSVSNDTNFISILHKVQNKLWKYCFSSKIENSVASDCIMKISNQNIFPEPETEQNVVDLKLTIPENTFQPNHPVCDEQLKDEENSNSDQDLLNFEDKNIRSMRKQVPFMFLNEKSKKMFLNYSDKTRDEIYNNLQRYKNLTTDLKEITCKGGIHLSDNIFIHEQIIPYFINHFKNTTKDPNPNDSLKSFKETFDFMKSSETKNKYNFKNSLKSSGLHSSQSLILHYLRKDNDGDPSPMNFLEKQNFN